LKNSRKKAGGTPGFLCSVHLCTGYQGRAQQMQFKLCPGQRGTPLDSSRFHQHVGIFQYGINATQTVYPLQRVRYRVLLAGGLVKPVQPGRTQAAITRGLNHHSRCVLLLWANGRTGPKHRY
jgi:hypothetical protein